MKKIIFLLVCLIICSIKLLAAEKQEGTSTSEELIALQENTALEEIAPAEIQKEEIVQEAKTLKDESENEIKSLSEEKNKLAEDMSQDQIHEVVSGDTLYEIALKYKLTVANIKKVNELKGDVIYPGMKLKITGGVYNIQVDKSENLLSLYYNDKLVKQYSVATGKDDSTPIGEFLIVNKLENPTWFHAGAVVPPDSPENILGSRWLGFDRPGYGIHGTTMPETIGQHASAGCVRMKNEDVENLYSLVPPGTKVTVVD